MTEHGFEYPRRPFEAPEIDEHVTLHRGTDWLEPLGTDFGIARFKVAFRAWGAEWEDSPYLDLSDADKQAYDKALRRCERSEADWTVQAEPALTNTLMDQLAGVLAAADRSAMQYGDEYAECLHELGYAADDYTELYREVWRQFPSGLDAPTSLAGGGADWRQAVAFEGNAAAADASCRAELYDASLAPIARAIGTFGDDHADELIQLDREWEVVVADAVAAGLPSA